MHTITPNGDGWNARQFDQLKVNLQVHEMLKAMNEMQFVMRILIARINKCDDC